MFAKIRNLFRRIFGIGKYNADTQELKADNIPEKPLNIFANLVRVKLKHYSTIAELLKRNAKTIIVRLPDGHIIKRHIEKHVVGATQ